MPSPPPPLPQIHNPAETASNKPSSAGCKIICHNGSAVHKAPNMMGYVANWILPLAILLDLPYESLHRNRLSRPLIALLSRLDLPRPP